MSAQKYITASPEEAAEMQSEYDLEINGNVYTQAEKFVMANLAGGLLAKCKSPIKASYKENEVVVATYQTIGMKKEQEDTYFTTVIKRKEPQKIKKFLSELFAKVNTKIEKATETQEESAGTTANLVYVNKLGDNANIFVANAGDSRAFLLRRNIKTGSVTASRLSCDHTAGDVREATRIPLAGGKIIQNRYGEYRLGGCLEPTRGFGDKEIKGVSRIPEITQTTVPLNAGDEVFVVQACDGLFETLHESNFAVLAEKLLGKPVGDGKIHTKANRPADTNAALAEMFVRAAGSPYKDGDGILCNGSGDNITCTVTRLSPRQKGDLVFGTCDGHGGNQASILARDCFTKELEKEKEFSKSFMALV